MFRLDLGQPARCRSGSGPRQAREKGRDEQRCGPPDLEHLRQIETLRRGAAVVARMPHLDQHLAREFAVAAGLSVGHQPGIEHFRRNPAKDGDRRHVAETSLLGRGDGHADATGEAVLQCVCHSLPSTTGGTDELQGDQRPFRPAVPARQPRVLRRTPGHHHRRDAFAHPRALRRPPERRALRSAGSAAGGHDAGGRACHARVAGVGARAVGETIGRPCNAAAMLSGREGTKRRKRHPERIPSGQEKSPEAAMLLGFSVLGLASSARVLAEPEGFEPSMRLYTPYSLSRGAPSATRSQFLKEAEIMPSLRRLVGPDRRLCATRAPPTPYIFRRSRPRS
ncbi:unnamed protein product [Brugia timori]|uniref:DUF222 domain-containing protein n=1 Tax=Brugia timori TaxID=42155 RepID=A0A0R3QEM5_9BILA|nr:unnamed protein product [Brugia timori]